MFNWLRFPIFIITSITFTLSCNNSEDKNLKESINQSSSDSIKIAFTKSEFIWVESLQVPKTRHLNEKYVNDTIVLKIRIANIFKDTIFFSLYGNSILKPSIIKLHYNKLSGSGWIKGVLEHMYTKELSVVPKDSSLLTIAQIECPGIYCEDIDSIILHFGYYGDINRNSQGYVCFKIGIKDGKISFESLCNF